MSRNCFAGFTPQHGDLPVNGGEKPEKVEDERGLPAAVGPKDGYSLAATDREVQPAQVDGCLVWVYVPEAVHLRYYLAGFCKGRMLQCCFLQNRFPQVASVLTVTPTPGRARWWHMQSAGNRGA